MLLLWWKLEKRKSSMTNKQRYEIFCNQHPEIPLFMQAWWLDAVCLPEGKEWDVLFVEENGNIIAVMPYHFLKKWGFKLVQQPRKTQYTGLWINYPKEMKLHKRYSFEKRVMDNLIDQLEVLNLSHYTQNFHYSFTNWQPFYWRGFRQTTRYTYILKNIADLDMIFNNIQSRCKEKIRKGEREMQVDINLTAEMFYRFHKETLNDKNEKIAYSEKLLVSIFAEASKRKQGKIIAIRDKSNELLSAIFLVWDKNSAYNLNTARKTHNGSNDASAYMIWEAVKFLTDKTKNFDFEGSMIKGVANVNQQFGAEQVPYFHISKSNSKLFSFLVKMKNIK